MSILKGHKDPVILKKVSMRVWHLKDHLIAILKGRLEKNDGDIEKIKDISDLKREFYFGDRWLELDEEENEEEVAEEKSEEGEKFTLYRRNIDIPDEKMAHGKAILYEVNFNKIHFFCDERFHIGATIILKLDIPKSYGIAGIVVDCRPFDFDSKIISEIKYPYRVIAEFQFLKKGQATMLRNFLTAIDPRVSHEAEDIEEIKVEIPTEPSEEAPPEIDKQEEEKEEKESA
jgi:hypothetical protein